VSVRYTLPALADLEQLIGYIAQRSPQAAQRVLREIRDTERRIEQFPRAGRTTTRPMIRRIKVPRRPYLVFYQPMENGIIVHAVRHGARDPATMPEGL
jgi:toxin ParE1/3/4